MTGRYRLGHKIKHNLYRGDECIAHFHNDADALDAVRALNESAPPPGSPGDTERTPLDRAALRVMADDIRKEHTRVIPPGLYESPGPGPRCKQCVLRWPCPTVEILDAYIGEPT